MKNSCFFTLIFIAVCAIAGAQNRSALAATGAPRSSRGALFACDFNAPTWPKVAVAGTAGVRARFAREAAGTIDSYQGAATGALTLSADFSKATKNAKVSLSSGPLSLENSETNLAKLTLGFDVWLGEVRPIRVVVQSLSAAGQVTGARYATVLPPVEAAWHRFSLDLDKTVPLSGRFDPRAPQIQLIWQLSDADGLIRRAAQVLRVDNVCFSAPSFYVSADGGSDKSDGLTEKTAFATIQKAIDAAAPGDVICVMNGTYTSSDPEQIVSYTKQGSPARWIVLRACPGHHPELRCRSWNAIRVNGAGSYFEVRDLIVRGFRRDVALAAATADGTLKTLDGNSYYGDPKFNTNGIGIQSTTPSQTERPHHIRIVNNLVVDNPGGGISAIGCDYVSIENNVIRDNCHFMRYAGSGISVFHSWNFDSFKGHRIFVINNVTSGNRTFVPWEAIGKISDGNGIIIDDNINHQEGALKSAYEGRTLVQNNLSFGNGGSGIHAYASRFVDIVNNTAYLNAQSPELMWRPIFASGQCDDVRIFNNVMVAPRGKPLDLSTDKGSQRVLYFNNLLFGEGENNVKSGGGLGAGAGIDPGSLGTNLQADPKFVRPSLDPDVADFRLAAGSPGLGAGSAAPHGTPRADLQGRPRPAGKAPDIGAYQMAVR